MLNLVKSSILVFCILLGGSLKSQASDPKTALRENFTDENGHRQGYWRITGAIGSDEGYKDANLIEEGDYTDNKRQGIWKKYYPSGALLSEITFMDNKPYGNYKTFYSNGNVEEEGYWKGNKNTGSFKRYHENGNPSNVFTFNDKGKRAGMQSYFYENGKVQMTVEIDNGVAHGMLKMYASNGKLVEEKRITNGEVEPESVKIYAEVEKNSSQAMPALDRAETTPVVDKPNIGKFLETGKNTLYNRNKQVSQSGEFLEGRLWNGKWFRYDENGLLKQVEVYKEGRFIGYGLIDEANK